MDKLINVLEKKLMPIANKISSIKFLNALGKSFQLLLPIIIIGSFACLGAYIDIPAWTSFIEATGLVYVPTDFDTKRKALSRANAAEKGLK